MNIEKIYELQEEIEEELSVEEKMKLIRELLYEEYTSMVEYQSIHCYQLANKLIDILNQMINGRVFDEEYLKNSIKW